MTFKDRLRLLRVEKGLSQQELGNVLQLSKANVSKFETGKLQPSLQHLITLINYFAVPAEYLLGLSEERKVILESDPFREQMKTILNSEFTEIEKDILSRCLKFGLKQTEAIRNERMGYRSSDHHLK